MRHRLSGRKLNRTSAHRISMLRNLALALLEHEQIRTTLPKAKELRSYIEPIITKAAVDSVANRRWAKAKLANSIILNRLFLEVAPVFADRPGGYTRIIKCGFRVGDNAPMAYISMVDPVDIVEDEAEATETHISLPSAS